MKGNIELVADEVSHVIQLLHNVVFSLKLICRHMEGEEGSDAD